jgi:hypothetical protein
VTGALVAGVPMATARAATMKGTADSLAKWDPRIVDYVRFVEKERGLKFEHPIPVDFLSDKKFVKVLNGDDHKPTRAERTAADHYAGQLRALGLVEGDVDLIGANQHLDAASVTGFYSDTTKRMVIRGTDITDVVTRVTVVHELTHALQDQRYDLNKLNGLVRDSGQDFALTALIEGDASYVEEAYYSSLTPAEQDEYDNWDPAEHGAPAAPDESNSADVPAVLDVLQSAPYIFGLRFIAYVDAVEGSADDAFFHRPLSEENIIDPVSYQEREVPRRSRRQSSRDARRPTAPPTSWAPTACTCCSRAGSIPRSRSPQWKVGVATAFAPRASAAQSACTSTSSVTRFPTAARSVPRWISGRRRCRRHR